MLSIFRRPSISFDNRTCHRQPDDLLPRVAGVVERRIATIPVGNSHRAKLSRSSKWHKMSGANVAY